MSTTLFNVAVNSMVRHWISLMVEDGSVTQDGLGHAVAWSLGVFYMDGVLLISRDPECLKGKLNILIGLFYQIGLVSNIAKLKTMN